MNKPGDLMTIKAFAEASGRSQQAIYKQISTRLAPYVHEEKGQKYIERRALSEIFEIGGTKPNQPTKSPEQRNAEQRLYANMQAMIDMLQEQLKVKDQQLEEKDRQLAVKDKQIGDLTEAVKSHAQSINAERQNELAGTMKELLPETSAEASEVIETIQEEGAPVQNAPESGLQETVKGLSWGEIFRLKFKKGKNQ